MPELTCVGNGIPIDLQNKVIKDRDFVGLEQQVREALPLHQELRTTILIFSYEILRRA